ncbi:MAG: hypothetical protein JXA30_22700, partial [Deltaproteobacteria bacterium]|nr:hypothetical protein [Deltaproteobacteria bacterium]
MKLIDIRRDVLEGATNNCIYLPASRLAKVGATRVALLAGAIQGLPGDSLLCLAAESKSGQ